MHGAIFDRLAAIRQRLAVLAACDVDRQVFGASDHGYRLAPPLAADQLITLESALQVALPDDYRAFLSTIAASGAGPYYGLRAPAALDPAEWMPDGDDDARRPVRAPRMDLPFPFAHEAAHDAAPPPGANRLDGVLHLAHQGCGYVSLLVVSGARRGEVWTDLGHGQGPLTPEAASFVDWYEAWLDRGLLEWAHRILPDAAQRDDLTVEERAGIEAARPLLAHAATVADPEPTRPGDALRALGYLRVLDRDPAADELFARAAAITTDDASAQHHLDRARARRRGARWAEVRIEVAAGLAAAPRSLGLVGDLHTEDEIALLGLGDLSRARRAMEARAASAAFDLALHHRLAAAHVDAGDLDAAHAVLVRAVERGVGVYATGAEIMAAINAGQAMPPAALPRRIEAIYDRFVDRLRARHPGAAAALAARRPDA